MADFRTGEARPLPKEVPCACRNVSALETLNCIGEGTFGVVYRVRERTSGTAHDAWRHPPPWQCILGPNANLWLVWCFCTCRHNIRAETRSSRNGNVGISTFESARNLSASLRRVSPRERSAGPRDCCGRSARRCLSRDGVLRTGERIGKRESVCVCCL